MSKIELKITIVGDHSVGKTRLIKAYLEHYFSKEDSVPMNQFEGENYFIKETNIDGVNYKLHLYDTSSRIEPRILKGIVYPKTDCFVICYAVSNAQTFSNISKKWIPEIRRSCPSARMIVAGTKLDLKNCYGATRVTDLTLESFLMRYKIDAIVECSSRTLEGVNQVFREAIRSAGNAKHGPCVVQ